MGNFMRLLAAISIAIVICSCSTAPTNSQGWIEPVDAIRAANNDPIHGVRGEFIITVKALDTYPDRSFLNSELDYRDQRNLTIQMPTTIVPKLEQRLGVKFQELKNRRLVVLGAAKRVRIDFVHDNRPTGKYYYQTHVRVDSPTQVKFAE